MAKTESKPLKDIKVFGGKCEYCGVSIYLAAGTGAKGVCDHKHKALPAPGDETAGIAYLEQTKANSAIGDAAKAKAEAAAEASAPVHVPAPKNYVEMQLEAKKLNEVLPATNQIKPNMKKDALAKALDAASASLKAA